jgi:Sulfotransferase domain
MRICFVTTCKDRTVHLERTLPQNLLDNDDYPDCRFVVLNYASRDHLDAYLKSLRLAGDKLVAYRYTHPHKFRMAHAKNLAHRCGMREGADVLVNLDADNFTGKGFARHVADRMSEEVFMWPRMVKGEMVRGCNGRLAVTPRQFLAAGGYDEKFDTWSPDDKDFDLRLRNLGYRREEIPQHFLDAIPHNDKVRFREYPECQADQVGEFDDVEGSKTTVANFGDFGRGVVYRDADPEPIILDRVPTRVFGIGMHKTATTSLHHALEILGYHSAHWPDAHWAKAVWQEMTTEGRSLVLEKYYAACDLPITFLYRELDRAYPGSKFILTTREEGEWLESVRRHFGPDNPFRHTWDSDPFSHKAHLLLYGRRKFDADVFLERYRQHNAGVTEYFRGRRDDLLELDMSNGHGWFELCGFLRRRIPDAPYPKSFVTGREGLQ